MTRYIDAEALKRKLIDEKGFFPAIVARAIDDTPTADVVEVKHGEWIETQEMFYDGDFQSNYLMTCYKCSECGLVNTSKYSYCNCGARMDGGGKE